jgi:putative methyltransferase (TIGR01177 family)
MIAGFVEVSQESIPLASAEAVSSAEALGGRAGTLPAPTATLVPVEVPDVAVWTVLADRLALARRCLALCPTEASLEATVAAQGRRGGSAVFRRIGEPSGGGADSSVLACGRTFKGSGGRIDLVRPARRFWLVRGAAGEDRLLEEVASVDRAEVARRKMPLLPFQRPVSLPPRLARALVNLGRVREGEAALDPFLGTGALLAEAGLLGARLFGIDRDADMVRGALQNFTHLGLAAVELVVGDARQVRFAEEGRKFAVIVTDPPYGRSSSTGGAVAEKLVDEVVARWWDGLLPGGRLAIVLPSGRNPPQVPGTLRFRIPVRVHRSLTREFCLYERNGPRRTPG